MIVKLSKLNFFKRIRNGAILAIPKSVFIALNGSFSLDFLAMHKRMDNGKNIKGGFTAPSDVVKSFERFFSFSNLNRFTELFRYKRHRLDFAHFKAYSKLVLSIALVVGSVTPVKANTAFTINNTSKVSDVIGRIHAYTVAQKTQICQEGAETTGVSPNNNLPQERPTSLWDDDIVRTHGNNNHEMFRIKSLNDNNIDPDYSYDGLNKLIPVLFASEAREKFYASTCLEDITMAGIQGSAEIKQMGDRIWIPTLADVPVEDHFKGDQFEVDYLESPGVEMTVDYAKRFAFGVDEIDLKQVKIKDWISKYAGDANKQVKIAIERQVFGSIYADADASNKGLTAGQDANINLGVTGTALSITKSNVIDKILDASEVLSDNNVPEDDDWWMIIPNWMATMIKGSDLKNASMTGDAKSPLRNKGLIGEIDRFKVFKSNLLTKDTGTSDYHVLFGHRSAIWFVTQYTKVKMFEPEKGFAQAMKGLNVHGHGVLQPTALGEMVVKRG